MEQRAVIGPLPPRPSTILVVDDEPGIRTMIQFELSQQGHKILTAEPHEHHFRRKDGSSVWLDVTGTPMTDDSGKFTGVLRMCADVTGWPDDALRPV